MRDILRPIEQLGALHVGGAALPSAVRRTRPTRRRQVAVGRLHAEVGDSFFSAIASPRSLPPDCFQRPVQSASAVTSAGLARSFDSSMYTPEGPTSTWSHIPRRCGMSCSHDQSSSSCLRTASVFCLPTQSQTSEVTWPPTFQPTIARGRSAEDAGREDLSQAVCHGDRGARPEDREHEESRFVPPALAGGGGLPNAHTFPSALPPRARPSIWVSRSDAEGMIP